MLFVPRTENSEKYKNTVRNCSIYSLLIAIYFLGGTPDSWLMTLKKMMKT